MSNKRVTKNAVRKTIPATCDACGDGPVGGNCGESIECNSTNLENAIRENLSPEGVATLVMALQPAGSYRATTPEGERAIEQVIGFRNTLLEMIGVASFNKMMDELGF